MVRRLTLKLVESIKKSEHQADDLLREAQQKARQIIREAESQAAQLLKEGIAAARKRSAELLAEAKAEARQEAGALADVHQKEIEKIESRAEARLPEVVAMIAKKVVKMYADR